MWIIRMLLEQQEHENSAFVTLTYNDENCPVGGILIKKDLQDFIKRLRFYVEPRNIRYFAVGEYGEQSWRPHYHLILYGISPTEESVILKAWKKGFVYVGTAEQKSMQYVSGYIIKNMRSKNDKRLEGRSPEFICSSKRPGIGFKAARRIAQSYETSAGRSAFKDQGWFGGVVRCGGMYPLGRYLKDKIQEELKLDKVSKKAYLRSQMYQVYARKSSESTTEYEIKRKAKVVASMGRHQKQMQKI